MQDAERDEAARAAAHARRVLQNLVLSCEAGRLYGQGGFPGDAALLARLSGQVSDRTRILCEVFAGCPAHDPGSPRLHGGDAAFREAQAARLSARRPAVPPTLLLESRDIRLAGNALFYVEDGLPRVLFETFRPQDRHVVTGPGPEIEACDATFPDEGLTFLLNSAGSFNYGHWLIDDLPRLQALALLRAAHPGLPVTVALVAYFPHIDAARERSIALFLGDMRGVTVRFLDRYGSYRFARLHHATPSGLPTERKAPDALRFLNGQVRRRTRLPRWLGRVRRLGRPSKRRLFVDRHPGRGRALANRAAVMAVLERHGFEAFDPEIVGVRRQAVRFADAEIVVGIAGAGMANTVFCAAGTPLVYLVPEGWQDAFYWEIATACGHDYRAVFGPKVASEGPEHLHDFSVDIADLEAALAAAGPPRA